MRRKMTRQGRRWEPMNMREEPMKRKRKRVEERGSLLKFVGGVMTEMILSWTREKSSMLFCRSRIFLKKSLLSSLTGLTVGAGAIGGPVVEYEKDSEDIVVGAAG